MSLSLCLHCGELKVGAFNNCPECGEKPPELDGMEMCFTTHHLSEIELKTLGRAIAVLKYNGIRGDISLHAFLRYVSKKWPKILQYDSSKIDLALLDSADATYNQYLINLPGQETNKLQQPQWEKDAWEHARDLQMQEEEDQWKSEINGILCAGIDVASNIVKLMIKSGEGAFLQKISYAIRNMIWKVDYDSFVVRSGLLLEEAMEYERRVQEFRKRVKNGWSGKSKRRAEYFGGTHIRLIEIAEMTNIILKHKARQEQLVPLEYKHTIQKFRLSYSLYLDLVGVVKSPLSIKQV